MLGCGPPSTPHQSLRGLARSSSLARVRVRGTQRLQPVHRLDFATSGLDSVDVEAALFTLRAMPSGSLKQSSDLTAAAWHADGCAARRPPRYSSGRFLRPRSVVQRWSSAAQTAGNHT